MFYLNIDESGYLLSVSKTKSGGPVVESIDGFDLSGHRINAYYWNGSALVLDETRLAELDAEAAAKANAAEQPSQFDIIEAQVTYTAMMTDTLLEV